MTKIKLFCFPHAGGSSLFYLKWKKYLNPNIELLPIELAGRGRRFLEQPYSNILEAVDDVYNQMKNHLEGTVFSVFGHSLGTIFVYETIKKIQKEKDMLPMHAFFSGRYPLHIKNSSYHFHLPEEELIQYLINLGGVTKDLYQNKEMLKEFLPIVKADLKLSETYVLLGEIEPFPFDISILYGYKDYEVEGTDSREWAYYTSKQCYYDGFQGGHLFINEFPKEIIALINQRLELI